MKTKGTVELAVDQELLTAAMIRILQQREDALVGGRGGLERGDRRLQCELKAGADVDGLGEWEGGRHFLRES